jgi:hypothetical protein
MRMCFCFKNCQWRTSSSMFRITPPNASVPHKQNRKYKGANGRSAPHARARVSKVAQSLQCVRIREKLRFHRRALGRLTHNTRFKE